MKNTIQQFIFTSLITSCLIITSISFVGAQPPHQTDAKIDLDPLSNIQITFTLKEIRGFDTIDALTDPDFYVKLTIDDTEYISPTWKNMNYVTDPNWEVTHDVPDDQEWVYFHLQLWDDNLLIDTLCDISGHEEETSYVNSSDVELWYNTKIGAWFGEDYREPYYFNADPSGYGRLNGCDDNSIYQDDNDCELRFDITQTDPDGDGIPTWTETYLYHTDPAVDNTGEDYDDDGIPIEWEHKWGLFDYWYNWETEEYYYQSWFDPFYYDEQHLQDPDEDGLENIEEYLTSQWGSDPYRQDIFLELDQMALGPHGEGVFIPELSKIMLRDAYAKYNIMFFLDDHTEEDMDGGELVPFDENVSWEETQDIYWKYFMHQDLEHWKRGVFHYGIVTYHHDWFHGFCWHSMLDMGNDTISARRDCIHIATKEHEDLPHKYPLMRIIGRKSIDKEYHRAIIYASAIMHETGHVLGIFHGNTPGCDDQTGKFPWHLNWWKWLPYKSCMNYGWMYTIVDYSDGSRGRNDFDDWDRIDLTAFQQELW